MNKKLTGFLQLYLAFGDLLLMNLVYFIAHYFFSINFLISENSQYRFFCLLLNTGWLAIAFITNANAEKAGLSLEYYAKKFVQSYIYFLSGIFIYLFFFRMLAISRIFISVVLSGSFIMLFINRFVILSLFRYVKRNNEVARNVIVIGYNHLAKKLVSSLEQEWMNRKVVGFSEDYENVMELTTYPIVSNIKETMAVCRKYDVTEIYSTIAPEHNPVIYNLIKEADQNCIRFKLVPDLGHFVNTKMHLAYVNDLPVMSLRNEPLEDTGNRIKKRIFDIVVSLLVTVFILSWLIPLMGLLIWIESKGPVFFTQERSGKNNKHFVCLKFRSMRVNNVSDSKQASKDDDRITAIGRFLRRTSLDEFPQFINVLKGDMSIVGPRPHMLKHTDEYSRIIEKYMIRQFLKPGITGWAQINGFRGETINVEQMEKRVEHDLHYMENWSMLLDINIVFRTFLNTIKGEENAF